MRLARLLRLEARRAMPFWVFPPLLALGLLPAWRATRIPGVTLWVEASVEVRDAILFLGPATAALAAWLAGRERRRGTEDILATLPLPAAPRLLTAWVGATVWGLCAYTVIGGSIVAITARQAVWGRPILWVMAIGLLAALMEGAVGFAAGYLVPGRFAAPLVAVGLYLAQLTVGYGGFGALRVSNDQARAWLPYLSPLADLNASVWYGIEPRIGWQQSCFFLGVTVLALGVVALRARRCPVAIVACAVGLVALLAGPVLIAAALPPGGMRALSTIRRSDPTIGLIPAAPVCTAEPLPICVHPAYRTWLAENTGLINRLVAPLLGLPGAPTRAELSSPFQRAPAANLLRLDPQRDASTFANTVTQALVHDYSQYRDLSSYLAARAAIECQWAQDAIALWLVQQAGITTTPPNIRPEIAEAARRFAALPPEQQRAWLANNLVALRAGCLALSALP